MLTVNKAIGAPGPSNRERDALGDILQPLLVDLIALALHGKQAHWHVTGERFMSVHKQLDEIVFAVRDHSDAVAERAVALGVTVEGTPSRIAASTSLQDMPTGWLSDREAVRSMAAQLESLVARHRMHLGTLGDLDIPTQDLVNGIILSLEKHLWMLQAQLA